MFLLWLPWILRMSRPGKKVTRKTILMNSRIKEMELKERSSRSLLANVLDMDDDFRSATGISYAPTYASGLTNRLSGPPQQQQQPGQANKAPFPVSGSTYPGGQQAGHQAAEQVHGNMANMQSSAFGSRTGGFSVEEEIPPAPYCIQVRASSPYPALI